MNIYMCRYLAGNFNYVMAGVNLIEYYLIYIYIQNALHHSYPTGNL